MNKKIIFIIIVILIIGIGVWYFLFYNKNQNSVNEIIPEEEISEEQMRQTIVSLYFYNAETRQLST